MSENKYPSGIIIFKPHEKAPDFVKGSVVITPKAFRDWCNENVDLATDYKGEKQFKFSLKEGKKGLYLELDMYKKEKAAQAEEVDDLPF